jgi:methylglyoxal synthase
MIRINGRRGQTERKDNMDIKKRIGFIMCGKQDRGLIDWVMKNTHILRPHGLYAAGMTAQLMTMKAGLLVNRLDSKQPEGYQELANMIANGDLDILFLFWDVATWPRQDINFRMLLRLAVMYNVVVACNEATADFIVNSPIMEQTYLPMGKGPIGAIELIMAEAECYNAG